MAKFNINILGVVSMVVTVAGAILTEQVRTRNMNETIREEVNRAISERNDEEES